MISSRSACIGCAKIKVKCDKVLPRCGRCVRLGIDCHAQARRRGRPYKALTTDQTLPIPNHDDRSHSKNRSYPRAGMLYEPIRYRLRQIAQKGTVQGDVLSKYVALTKGLARVACSIRSKEMFDDLADILKLLNGESLDPFEEGTLLIENKSSETRTPSYISSMNCDGSAFIVHHFVNGSSLFLTNEDMAKQFVSTKEANSVYCDSGGALKSVLELMFTPQDLVRCIRMVTDLFINNPCLNCEASLVVNCRNRNTQYDTDLLLCQVRVAISADGRNVCVGTKFTSLPALSTYVFSPDMSQVLSGNHSSSSSSSSASNMIKNGDTGVNGYLDASLDDPNGDLEEDSQSRVLQSPQPQTRELLFHQEQQTESWSNVHSPDTPGLSVEFGTFEDGLSSSTNSKTLSEEGITVQGIAFESHIFPTVHHQKRDITIHLNIEPQVEDATTSTVNTKRKTYSSNSEGSSTKLPHYDDVSRDMNRRSIETCSDDEKAETKRSSPPQQLGFDQVDTFDAIDYQNMAESTADLEEFLELFDAHDAIIQI